jgi:hypothetical protein
MRKEESGPSNKSTKNTNKLSLKSLNDWSGFSTWRGFDSFDLCLGVNALALVLNENLRKLGCLEWWWLGGIYGRTGHCPVRQPHHPTVRVWELLTVGGFVL